MGYPSLLRYPVIAYDTETTGLEYPRDRVFGFSIATPDDKSYYFDIRRTPKARNWINDHMSRYKGIVVCANASFDYRMSYSTGIDLPINQLDDVIIRASLINEHLHEYSLDSLAQIYLGEFKESEIYEQLAALFGGRPTRKQQMPRIKDAPFSVVKPYAVQDAVLTLKLWLEQERIRECDDLTRIMNFERVRMPTFIRAEMRGIRVDLDHAEQAMIKMIPVIDREQKKLNKLAGREFNTNSGPQIQNLFEPKQQSGKWFANDGTMVGTTGNGGPSFRAEFLREMAHPAAGLILDIRSMLKTRDTFIKKHVLEHAYEDRVYPTISQTQSEVGGAGTGRVQYSDPAMQQIPSRNKEVAAIVKPCFLPDEGQVWVDCDKASFEVRVFYHLVNNPEVNERYRLDPTMDAHQVVADLTGLVRNATYGGQPNAKQLNLSMIFNQGNGTTAKKMGMDAELTTFTTRNGEEVTYLKAGHEAMRVIEHYHEQFPGVKELAEKCKNQAINEGYVQTYAGRKLRFPHGHKAYKASGILIQATAADINKENWLIIEEQLGDCGHLILNTHDSYSMSIEKRWRTHFNRVKKAIERPLLNVPMLLELSGHGNNWWQALQGDKR